LVSLNESSIAVTKTPGSNAAQKLSFVYNLFFDRNGAAKPIKILAYEPGQIIGDGILLIKNQKLKLRRGPIIESDFIVIPSYPNSIFIPLAQVSEFCENIKALAREIGSFNER
jgi:hypothetical protein